MKRLTITFLFLMGLPLAQAQMDLQTAGVAAEIDFTGFTGSGFAPSPAAGQLDSDTFSITGFSDGALAFGGTATSGDFARGTTGGGVSTGGVYARGDGFWLQPGGSDLTPGTIIIAVQNNTGSAVDEIQLAYDLQVLNDTDRGNTFNFEYAFSPDCSAATAVPALDFTSPETADALGVTTTNQSTTISGLAGSLTNGALLYLCFQTDDSLGGGSRDEFGLDNISVTAGAAMDTAPTVTSTDPLDMATDVPLTQQIEINYSEAVNSTGAYAIDCSGAQSFTTNPTDLSNASTVTLIPDANLPESTSCTVTVTAANVQDLDGTPDNLAADFGFSFTTAAADMTPPTISSVTPSTTGPTAATSIDFTVAFSEDVSDFDDSADVTVNHSGTNSTTLMFTEQNASTYTVTVSGISGMGSFTLTVNAGSVVDGSANANADMLTSSAVTIDPSVMPATPDGLLLTELLVTPNDAEFVEIYNTTGSTIDLSDVYLTDATFAPGPTFYYQIVSGAGGGGGFSDFHARFPDGATIDPGEYQTVALSGSTAFMNAYGQLPTYELFEDDGAPDAVGDMREATAGSINGQGGFSNGTNDGEVLILYYWDGATDLVSDLDYILWGDKFEAVDKTGVMIDGPDGDATASTYLDDTPTTSQTVIDPNEHAAGNSWQRADLSEATETMTGGNGISGADETSENLRIAWGEGVPTPNAATGGDVVPPGPTLVINEVNSVDTAGNDYVELFDGGLGNTSLTGLVLVLFDSTDQSYAAVDLDGLATDGSGYSLLDNTTIGGDLDDGPAAIAIFIGDDTDFPNGTSVTTTGLIDAVVYGTPDDAGLLVLLNAAEPQLDEDTDMTAATDSLQRCPNGSGGARNTSTFAVAAETPGILNMNCPVGDYYANVDDTNATTLRTTLHDTIDDHQWFPYSSSSTDTWDILEMADEDPNNSSNVLAVYSNTSYAKFGGGVGPYNREHTWPRSRGLGETGTDLNSTATDAHNLRISTVEYNSDRGSRAFDYCDPAMDADCTERMTIMNDGVGGGSGGAYPGNSNWFTANTDGENGSWDVWFDRRGDVARTMFYMDVRYEGGTHGVTGRSETDLVLTNNRSLMVNDDMANPAYMGLLSTLLEWHAQDPVDAKEMARNEVVFSFQGNRNPFVDHPEWVACIFESDCGSMVDDPPQVASTDPADMATGVDISTTVVINFSEAVDSTGAFALTCGTAQTFTTDPVDISNASTVRLIPNADLPAGTACTLTITAANVVDLDGTPDNLGSDVSIDFTTQDPPPAGIVINEINADPDAALGDANGDGVVDTADDEFVEIFNNSGMDIDMSGWELEDGASSPLRHVFPAGTMVADGCAIVVFGAGTPTGSFGNAIVQTASTGAVGLNNSGDTVTLKNELGQQVAQVIYDNDAGANQSITRDPDVTGAFVRHASATGSNSALFSPGTQINGSDFIGCAPEGAPVVSITAPVDSAIAMEGTSVMFAATAIDDIDGDVAASLIWESDIDGMIGTGGSFSLTTLSLGNHTIVASATDSESKTGRAQVRLTISPSMDLEVFEIQGDGYNSPFAGLPVTTTINIVTAVGPEGFFMQTPDVRDDGDPNTSNGIFVFTFDPPSVVIGDSVMVSGGVSEFFGFTEITATDPTDVTMLSSGEALPTPIAFDAATPSGDPEAPSCVISGGTPAQGENANFECFEGMLITIANGSIGSGNLSFGGMTPDTLAEVGITAGARAMREPGVAFPGLDPMMFPDVPVFDGNPEVFELDLDALGGPNRALSGGSTFSADGVIGFEFSDYELFPTRFELIEENVLPNPVRQRASDEFTVGSLNMFRLYDDVDDPLIDDSQEDSTTTMDLDPRLAKFSRYIREALDSPDILAVQEVENLNALQLLAMQLNSDDATLGYSAELVEGNDRGGIDVGFLVRPNVTINGITQMGQDERISTDPNAFLHDRPPLMLDATVTVDMRSLDIMVLVVHMRSLGGIEGNDAARVRLKRLEQSQSIAQMIQAAQSLRPIKPVVVVGDFNAFEFTDGYVDVMGQVKGDIKPEESTISGPDLVEPNFTDAVLSLPTSERYSFIFGGFAQALDHALLSSRAAAHFRDMAFGRGNADAARSLADDPTNALGESDHDGFAVFLSIELPEDMFGDGFETGTPSP